VADIPDGWTDDMRVPLAPGRTVEELVDHVLRAALEGRDTSLLLRELVTTFGLSEEDAELALDRVFGGIVRAATKNPANCPDREKDPIAWASFDRGIRQPSVVAALYPPKRR
jgi:hypothetical protein